MLSDNEYNEAVRRRQNIRGDNIFEYFETCRNGRMILLYLFAAFVIIRIWILVVNTQNSVFISITAVAMAIVLILYFRCRLRFLRIFREENIARMERQRDIPSASIQEFLAIQAAMRSAQNRGQQTSLSRPLYLSMLIAALPTTIYNPPTPRRTIFEPLSTMLGANAHSQIVPTTSERSTQGNL